MSFSRKLTPRPDAVAIPTMRPPKVRLWERGASVRLDPEMTTPERYTIVDTLMRQYEQAQAREAVNSFFGDITCSAPQLPDKWSIIGGYRLCCFATGESSFWTTDAQLRRFFGSVKLRPMKNVDELPPKGKAELEVIARASVMLYDLLLYIGGFHDAVCVVDRPRLIFQLVRSELKREGVRVIDLEVPRSNASRNLRCNRCCKHLASLRALLFYDRNDTALSVTLAAPTSPAANDPLT